VDSLVYEGLKWPELVPGILIKRYKRFLADVRIKGVKQVTAHCPNAGSMNGCCEPGRPVYLSYHDNLKRKLKYGWELIEMPTSLFGGEHPRPKPAGVRFSQSWYRAGAVRL
jgi:sugar fermentation stimulation protein A